MNRLGKFMCIDGMESLNPLIRLSKDGDLRTYDELLSILSPGQAYLINIDKIEKSKDGKIILEVS